MSLTMSYYITLGADIEVSRVMYLQRHILPLFEKMLLDRKLPEMVWKPMLLIYKDNFNLRLTNSNGVNI